MKRLLALIFGLLLIACCYANRDNGMVQDAAQLLPVSALAVSTCPEGYLMTIESIQQDSLDGDAAPAYFSVKGTDFSTMFEQADSLLASRLYLSHAQVILASKEVLQQALPALADSLLARPDARLTLRIATVEQGDVADVLCAESIDGSVPGMALAELLDQRAADGTLADAPLFRILDWQQSNQPVALPVLGLTEDGYAAPAGSALLQNGEVQFLSGGGLDA